MSNENHLTANSVAAVERLAGTAETGPRVFTLKQRFALFVHDVIAHPLTWITRDAAWVWRLHDWSGRVVLAGKPLEQSISVSGPGSHAVVSVLQDAGFQISHTYPRPDEVHSPYQTRGVISEEIERKRRVLQIENVTRPPRSCTNRETVDLVEGDQVAWQGHWLTIATIRSGDDGNWVLELENGVDLTAQPNAKWRVR